MKQRIQNFKRGLACVFDENLHTKMWHNVVDWVIIALIVVSTVEVFLSTFEGMDEKIGGVLRVVDLFTTVFFTIEVTLRIWAADEQNPKYKGFWGRVRYCFTFYGLIDFLSTYSFYVALIFPIPYVALKMLRVLRLFRIFRYLKSFRILGEAVASKKQELGISMVFLVVLTVILSFLLYFAEHAAQPEMFSDSGKTLIWAFAKYLGDPGKIADFPLVTVWGNIIAIIVGILGIAIFAVPAGLIGSGFVEVIEAHNKENETKNNIERVKHTFRWERDNQDTLLFAVPPYKPLYTILTRQMMPEDDIIQAVKASDCFHLYNMAKAFSTEDAQTDSIVVVNYLKNTPYGCCIDRGSNVTLVSTSGYDEPITSWVVYHIAKLGGFNYVGKEVEYRPENPVSYYNLLEGPEDPNLQLFLADIDQLSSRPDSWVIPMCFCTGSKSRKHKIHFSYSTVKHDETYDNPDKTFEEVKTFDAMAADLAQTMEATYGLKTDKNRYYTIQPKSNLLYHLNCRNGFALRIESHVIYFASNKLAMIKSIADVLARDLAHADALTMPPEMQRRPAACFGFGDYVD